MLWSLNMEIFFLYELKLQGGTGLVPKRKGNQRININPGNSLIVNVFMCACMRALAHSGMGLCL